MLRVASAPDGIEGPLLVAAVGLPPPEELLPEELLLEELPFEAELPLLLEPPLVDGALLEPPSVPPEATVLAESDASAPPHPAKIEMTAKFRRTKRKMFFRIVFTCFFRILAGSTVAGSRSRPGTARHSFRRSLLFASSTGHTKGVAINVARPARPADWTCGLRYPARSTAGGKAVHGKHTAACANLPRGGRKLLSGSMGSCSVLVVEGNSKHPRAKRKYVLRENRI